jgi:hypothetical protein
MVCTSIKNINVNGTFLSKCQGSERFGVSILCSGNKLSVGPSAATAANDLICRFAWGGSKNQRNLLTRHAKIAGTSRNAVAARWRVGQANILTGQAEAGGISR